MTDEEENKCLTGYKKLFCANCEADCTTSILDCNGYQLFFKGYEQGYEDCRHYAHDYYKPKWHKVADKDYPAYEKGGFTVNVFTDRGEIAYYNHFLDSWISEPASVEIDPPAAWCEIPKYKE